MLERCPACASEDLDVFYSQRRVPVQSCALVPDQGAALSAPRGDIDLALCADCGFICNASFDSSLVDYDSTYEETQEFSPRFREFADALANRWVERYALRGKRVLEVGCGKGGFLARLLDLGVGHAIGLDPAAVPERLPEHLRRRVAWLVEPLAPAHARVEADAVVCRHTLEHIQLVGDFLRLIRPIARPGTPVLFEVPDVCRILEEGAFWDIYYEHCSYFGPGPLRALFTREGFAVEELWAAFDGQYLVLEALPKAGDRPKAEADLTIGAAASAFAGRAAATLDRWRSLVGAAYAAGERLVVWGGGSKAVACLNLLDRPRGVAYVVDINPHKQGAFIPGTGHPVVAPAFLRGYRPHRVVVMNPVYLPEVRATVLDLRLEAEVTAI